MGIDLDEMIEKIIDNGNLDDMQTLSELLEDTMEIIKDYDKDCYKEMEMKLYKMAYGCNLNREMADEIVRNMQPNGMRWSIDETRNLQNQYGLGHIKDTDFYVVMNSAYNDYRDLFNDNVEDYMKFTLDFIQDEDAVNDKVFVYFTTIPRK